MAHSSSTRPRRAGDCSSSTRRSGLGLEFRCWVRTLGLSAPLIFDRESAAALPILGTKVIISMLATNQVVLKDCGAKFRAAASWPVPCAVLANMSPAQLRPSDLARAILDILASTACRPGASSSRSWKTLLIADTDEAFAFLARVRDEDVEILLDDFGTGYSSLSYLWRFPFSNLKIDKTFVHNLGRDREDDAIVRAILALARSLHFCVTAEGSRPMRSCNSAGSDATRSRAYVLARLVAAGEVARVMQSARRQGTIFPCDPARSGRNVA